MTRRKLWSSAVTVTILPAWIRPTWIFWVASMMPPREETRRCTVTGPVRRGRAGSGPAGATQPVPVTGGNRAGQGPQQFPLTADDHHLGAVHPQDDPLPGQPGADADLGACQAGQAGGIDHALDLDRRAVPGRKRAWPGGTGAAGGQARQLGDAETGRQRLAQVLPDEPHHPEVTLQLRNVQVAVDPVDALQLEDHMAGQDI